MMQHDQDQKLLQKIHDDIQRYNETRKHAEGVLRDRGFNDTDEDFDFHVEIETKRQWNLNNQPSDKDIFDHFFGFDE